MYVGREEEEEEEEGTLNDEVKADWSAHAALARVISV
jgi:hypothetical protein